MIINEVKGIIDPMIYTGRGSWVPMSRTTLERLLRSFDRAYPKYTNGTRGELVDNWRAAEQQKRMVAA